MMTHVFGYGSLAHRGSLSKGLQRPISDADLTPATLLGYRRIWGASEEVLCASQPGTTTARFLDLVRREGGEVNGVLVPVTPDELSSLVIREKAYALHDVTGRVRSTADAGRIVTFASPPGTHFVGSVVLAEYVRLVEEAFEALAPGERARFRQLTELPPVPVIEGLYRFVDPEQNARTSRAGNVVVSMDATR